MRFLPSWLLAGAFALGCGVGCNKSPEGGTPNTSSSFTIKAPATSTTVKQDAREPVKLTLDRGKDFHKDVKLKAESTDSKIKVELDKDTIKASDASPADFNVTVTPAKDAPVGEHKIKVTGTPDGGAATTVEFTVKVAAP